MKTTRTPKAVQKAQKHATRIDRHAMKADLRSLVENATYEQLQLYSDIVRNQRTIVRVGEMR